MGKTDKRLHARTTAPDFAARWAATFGAPPAAGVAENPAYARQLLDAAERAPADARVLLDGSWDTARPSDGDPLAFSGTRPILPLCPPPHDPSRR